MSNIIYNKQTYRLCALLEAIIGAVKVKSEETREVQEALVQRVIRKLSSHKY